MIPTYKIFLRTENAKKNGSIPVYLRVVINRKKKDYSLGVSIFEPEKYWNDSQKRVKRATFMNITHINRTIEDAESRAGDIIRELKRNNEPLTINAFDKLYKNPIEVKDSFYSFATREIEIMKQMNGSKETTRSYNSYVSKLKKFRPSLTFGEIDLPFIQQYHADMLKNHNMPNTVHKSLAFISAILNKAIRAGIIRDNVFKNYPLHKEPGKREFLTIDELDKLEMELVKGELKRYIANCCRYFLFSCYTGLRYQDIKNLSHEHIKKEIHNNKEQTFIRITMHKTKEPISIPIIERALKHVPDGFKKQKVFRVASNQVCNRYVKELMIKAKIDKKISFHCARHTFATVGITIGIPIEVISKLLGHHDLKTTMIYSKIVDQLKIDHMAKWDNM